MLSIFLTAPQRSYSTKTGEDSNGVYNQTTATITPIGVSAVTELIETTNNVVTYNEICNVENLELGLKRTKSGVSAGLDGEIKANYTTGKLEKLAGELKSHSFKASPIKKV